ncbi:hypothetical protein DRJ16_04935 [Candidatus Woesearchaeota archaeon]|nr:MAG: hypothetical protein DRJ16_04935 [Candidatus Woesearchaeota archaeon]
MKKETLSDKRFFYNEDEDDVGRNFNECGYETTGEKTIYQEKDVKEFIKKLQDFCAKTINDSYEHEEIQKEIDKLAGEELV